MGLVGYFQGTDPRTLNRLVVRGIETLPLSNGWDANGKLVAHLTPKDGVGCVIGNLYKAIPVGEGLSAKDILWNLHQHMIPVVLVVEDEDHDAAKKLLGEVADGVKLTSRENLFDVVNEILAAET